MKTTFVSLLLLVPLFAWSQFINPVNNNYPVYTFNSTPGVDHATDVHNYHWQSTGFTQTVMTGFYTNTTEFWGYNASTLSNTLLNTLSDPASNQSFFATAHDATGALTWFLTSLQSNAGATFGTSKMAFNANTDEYVFCVEYSVPFVGFPIEIFSSTSGLASIFAPGTNGLLNIQTDAAGTILNVCSVVSSSASVELEDIDLDDATGLVFATGYRQGGGLSNAYVLSYQPATCGALLTVTPSSFANNSWGRGIDVENGEVYVVGDYENTLTWPLVPGVIAPGSQDVYVLLLDITLNPVTITAAQADFYAEGYDVEVFAGPSETYVSGSIQENSNAWSMGNFGPAPPGALHGFIQVFDPTLAPTCNYVHVLATGPGEFFKMVDLDENVAPVTGTLGLITIGGNMNHSGPIYDYFTGCAPSSSTPFTSPAPEAGFVLRVNDHPEPVWGNISTLTSSLPAPVVTSVSNFEEDIFVGGYKLTDAILTPSSVGDLLPSLGSLLPNAYYTYIYSQYGSGVGDFLKTEPTAVEQAEEKPIRFAVYPNPANEVFYLRVEDDVQLQQVILKDLTGRDIRSWNGQEAAGGLSIGDIPSGIYFLEIESEGVRATERVVIR